MPEQGIQSVYCARKLVASQPIELIAYQSGTGSVVLLSSTRKYHSVQQWTAAISSICDARLFKRATICNSTPLNTPVDSSKQMSLEFKAQILEDSNTYEATKCQGYNIWRVAMEFMVTSTVSEKIIRLIIKNENEYVVSDDANIVFFRDMLGLSTTTGNVSLSDDLLKYSEMTCANL